MTVTVSRSKVTLTAADFISAATLNDPHDGTAIDALTNFDYDIPWAAFQTISGHKALNAASTFKLTPNCKRQTAVVMTAGLLSHEQFHWDCAFVIARQFAREAAALRGTNDADLTAKFNTCFKLHFVTRNKLIQSRYDVDSHHGTNAHYQKIWKDRMTACLSNASATQLGGFWL